MNTTNSGPDERRMVFAFLGVERERGNTIGEDSEHTGRVFVYRSLPGNVVSWGNSEQEAVERLRQAIEFAMGDSSPQEWYAEQRKQLSESDERRVLNEMTGFWSEHGVKCMSVEFQTASALAFYRAPMVAAHLDMGFPMEFDNSALAQA